MRKEVVVLKDEPHLQADAAQRALLLVLRPAIRPGCHHRLPADGDGTAVHRLQMVDAAQQRALA